MEELRTEGNDHAQYFMCDHEDRQRRGKIPVVVWQEKRPVKLLCHDYSDYAPSIHKPQATSKEAKASTGEWMTSFHGDNNISDRANAPVSLT